MRINNRMRLLHLSSAKVEHGGASGAVSALCSTYSTAPPPLLEKGVEQWSGADVPLFFEVVQRWSAGTGCAKLDDCQISYINSGNGR